MHDRPQLVRDQQHRGARQRPPQQSLHGRIAGVPRHMRCHFIQAKHPWLPQQHPRRAQQLPLAYKVFGIVSIKLARSLVGAWQQAVRTGGRHQHDQRHHTRSDGLQPHRQPLRRRHACTRS